jgi:hypothetical protein
MKGKIIDIRGQSGGKTEQGIMERERMEGGRE